jgi:hypothetical protein
METSRASQDERKGEMERVGTVFVLKEDEEYCFLFERDNPASLFSALFDCAERSDLGLSRQEVLEMIEGMVPERLRSI